MPSVATWIQYAAVVGVPAFCAQKVALCTWSAVRVSEIWRISASAAVNAVDPNAGGGAGRNWFAEVRNQRVTPGSGPPAIVAGVVLLIHSPEPVGMIPVNGRLKPSACARATISAPTARPADSPRANAGCTPPGPAFACVLTMLSSA